MRFLLLLILSRKFSVTAYRCNETGVEDDFVGIKEMIINFDFLGTDRLKQFDYRSLIEKIILIHCFSFNKPVPDECRKFFNCDHGQCTVMCCADGMKFSKFDLVCITAAACREQDCCLTSNSTTTTTTSTTTSTTTRATKTTTTALTTV